MFKTFSATITPLKANGGLDVQGLSNIFARNARHGLTGAFILGSMGEWPSFDEEFKERYVAEATRLTRGKLKLLVGVNSTSLALSLKLMKQYEKYPFEAYVFMNPGASRALDPVKSVLTVLDTADRPVYLYYCPPNTQITFTLDQFEAILKHPNLAGIKNSASNMWLRRELIHLKRENGCKADLLEGQEWALDEALLAGYDGMVCGMGALASRIMVNLAKAAEKCDWKEAVRLQNVLITLYHGVYGLDLSCVWVGQKYALKELGLIESELSLAQEMSPLTEARKTQIRSTLASLKSELD